MQKRIDQIARGRFDYDRPALSLPEEELSFHVTEGQEYTGNFDITVTNHIPVCGIVYSTNPRMECLTPQFEGEEVRIRYQFHSKGLVEGEVQKGEFVIVCNHSVHSLPFCVSVSRLYADASTGPVRSLYDFACLARENWDEAYKIFYHKSFPNIIKPKEMKEAMIYRGIQGAKPSPQNMEEFLIGIRKKKKINFTLSQTAVNAGDVTETVKQTIEIKKDEWGYLEINISADADFVRLTNKKITTGDFIGSTYVCEMLLDYDRMHEGNNFCRVTFSSAYETKILEISVHKGERKKRKPQSVHSQIRECSVGLVELYEAYRLKRLVTGVWSNETVEILDHLHALDPDNAMYLLMKAQALVINRQRQEAEWILDEFKRGWKDRHAPEWGYYLYILTLMEREPSYVDRMTREIELIFRIHPESPLLFWTLSFLKEDYYNNSAHKLKAMENWIMDCPSPYLYLEAYYLICQEPYLLSSLGPFEVRILRWAVRKNALTTELAERIFEVIELNRGFVKTHYDLLSAAYDMVPTPEHAGIICSYLIRAQKFDVRYHHWFEMGIQMELRITSLYEAYLYSLDERAIGSVPKIIQMYFQYDSRLPYRKMAILYSNIIASSESNREIYEKYRQTMSRFAMEQVEKEHMDDNLAVIYDDMLELGLVNGELAHHLSRILFTRKLVLFDKRMVRAIIYQKPLAQPQIVPIVDRAAYFQLYSDDYVILFEDEKGQRYVSSLSYRLEKLMDSEKYLEKCMDLAEDELPYVIAHFEKKPNYLTYDKTDERFFKRILFAEELNPVYQSQTALEILRYCQAKKEDPLVTDYLAHADFSVMPQSIRRYMMEMLVDNRLYDLAFEMIQIYGMDQIKAAARVTLASYMIDRMGDEEKDEYLLQLSENAFEGKKYNDRVLNYLARFYQGPVPVMLRIWHEAREFEIPTRELEERIMIQMLYSDMDLRGTEDLFGHYYETGGRQNLVMAWLSACAHAYFVDNREISPDILFVIRQRFLHHQELNDACKLALFKSLSEKPAEGEDYDMEDALLSEYTSRNMNFAFYRKLDRKLIQKYHLSDKVFLEYHTDPKKQVVLHYSRNEDGENFQQEDMRNVYDGVFVKQFILFFGEAVQYYITEEYANQVEVKLSSRITGSSDIYSQQDESRYSLLNQMLMSETLSDENALYKSMKQYAGLDEVTKKVFKLL